MKRLSAWLTLGSFAALGSLTAISCGSDEATGDDGSGGGGIVDGGTDSGVVRDGGSTQGAIGRACVNDSECGAGLTCITRSDTSALGGAPPKGLCTLSCSTHDTCLEHSADAYCVQFNRDSYCVEGCTAGDSLSGEKCHNRPEMVCHLLDFLPGDEACEDSSECGTGELCNDGTCDQVVTACMPSCGSDQDCANGLFCDFRTGLCVEDEPTGKGFNELCDPNAAVDECQGYCFASFDDEDVGTCGAFCSIFNPYACGYDGEGKADSACLFPTAVAPDPGAGDLGLCGQLCDCNDECSAPGELCAPFDSPELEDIWQRLGYCRPLVDGDDFSSADSLECEGGGEGGAGGAPSSGAGGAGGAPASAGGAGGAG